MKMQNNQTQNPKVKNILDRVLNNSDQKTDPLTGFVDFLREFGSLGDVLGREFEVKTPEGELKYIIHQKAINMPQLMILTEELAKLKERENNPPKGKTSKGLINKKSRR